MCSSDLPPPCAAALLTPTVVFTISPGMYPLFDFFPEDDGFADVPTSLFEICSLPARAYSLLRDYDDVVETRDR